MNPECAEHEIIIVERVTKIIEDKVEYSLQKKLIPITRWMTGSIVTFFSIFITILLSNVYSMGKIELYIEQQKELNISIVEKLDKTQTNQMYTIWQLKKIDPEFEVPYNPRGEVIKN